jgi:hypothetical protein
MLLVELLFNIQRLLVVKKRVLVLAFLKQHVFHVLFRRRHSSMRSPKAFEFDFQSLLVQFQSFMGVYKLVFDEPMFL